jgi:hypothetical protein
MEMGLVWLQITMCNERLMTAVLDEAFRHSPMSTVHLWSTLAPPTGLLA